MLPCCFKLIYMSYVSGKGVTFPKQDERPKDSYKIKEATRKEYPECWKHLSYNTYIQYLHTLASTAGTHKHLHHTCAHMANHNRMPVRKHSRTNICTLTRCKCSRVHDTHNTWISTKCTHIHACTTYRQMHAHTCM